MYEDPLGISIRSERGDFLSDFRIIGDFIISDLIFLRIDKE